MSLSFFNRIKGFYNKIKSRVVGSHELSSIYFKQVNGTLIIKLISVLISFIYIPVVLNYLDPEKFGIWVTLNTVVHWLRLADVGIGGGMRLKLSESIALKDREKGRIYVSTTYIILGTIFLLMLIVFYVVNSHVSWQAILNSSIISATELLRITSITVTFVVLGFILKTVNNVFLAHGVSIAEGMISLIISIITLSLVWLTSRFADKGNLVLLATIVTGIPVIVYFFVSIYTFYVKFPHLKPSLKYVRLKGSKALLVMSLQSFISSVTYLAIYGSVPFVVAQLFSPGDVTIFNIAYSMFNLPIMLISLVVMPVKPLITLAYAKRDYRWIRFMQKKLNNMAYLIIAGTVLMIIFNQFIYHIWIGDKVAIPYLLSVSIGIFAIINILQFSNSIIVLGTGKMIINAVLSPINISLYLTLSIVLSKLLHNVIGVSIALAVTCLIPLIVYPFWLRKVMPEN